VVVIAYDICDERRLQKVAKFLENEGIRAQRSVFELDMSVRAANKIFNGIKELIDENEDKCFMFSIFDKEDIQGDTSIERVF
jgi:CRISPR-associated protein Cas2